MKTLILPGMGATHQMYPEPWRSLPNVEILDWPLDDQSKTIPDLAAALIEKYKITSSDRLIGSSLGGMVACEISNQISLRQVVLIGSALHPDEIQSIFRFLHPAIKLIPLKLIHRFASGCAYLPLAMFAKSDPEFIRRMCSAVYQWKGDQGRSPVYRIHGTRDLMIPCPVKYHLALKGGHLIATTHAEECCEAIAKL